MRTGTGGRVYAALLILLPRRFRDEFAEEMLWVFEERLGRCKTRRDRVTFIIRSLADLLVTAVVEAPKRTTTVRMATPEGPTVGTISPGALKPLTGDQLAVSRRQFLNRAWTLSFAGFLGFFGMSSLSFLWPRLTGGFGTKIKAGRYKEILNQVGPAGGFKPLFNPEGRFYLTYYDGTGDAPAYDAVGATRYRLQALYRKCVHLGCSVPHCSTSLLFECPCHGSKYRLSGEHLEGPAPRGLDRFPIEVVKGVVVVDTGALETGPPRGTNTWHDFAGPKGPVCVPRS